MKLSYTILFTWSFQLAVSELDNFIDEQFHEERNIVVKDMANNIATYINEFNFKFNEVIRKDATGNTIFSPFSIYSALTMLGEGAANKTKDEVAAVLGWKDTNFSPLLEMLKPFYTEVSKRSNGTTLDVANKAWADNKTDILESYQQSLKKYFGVELGREDFSNNSENATKDINSWVAEKTDNNIKDLFPAGSIEAMTKLVLANAVYFKGEWKNKFDELDTYEDEFYITKDEKLSNVKFMFKHDKFSTAVDKEHNLQLLELPYAGGLFSIIFAIPITQKDEFGGIEGFEDLSKVENRIKDKTRTLSNWVTMLPDIKKVYSDIDIAVPKFEIQLDVDLLKKLEELGIKEMFTAGQADLSGINGKRDLYVSSAFHKAFMKVDEEGTTAAAATGFAANAYSMNTPEEVFLNHPFLFYIIHKQNHAIIFSGKVQNPLS